MLKETLRCEEKVNEVVCVAGFAGSSDDGQRKKDGFSSGLFVKVVISLCWIVTVVSLTSENRLYAIFSMIFGCV